MAYNAKQLVTSAYYASGIVSREFETVSGTQSADGLQWLNEILAEKRVDDGMIPYESQYSFNAESGVEKYYVPNLIKVDTIVFYLNSVRYQLRMDKRQNYYGSSRIETIASLPYKWYYERQTGGGNLYIYFKPDRNYPIEVHGIFDLNEVTEFQDLSVNATTFNLGISQIYGSGVLSSGQLTVNNIDLAGTYGTAVELERYINTGVVPGVTASLVANELILSSSTQPPIPMYIRTSGQTPSLNIIGPVAAASVADLVGTYNNGTAGVGATLTNAPALAALVVDGYTVSNGDRILVKDQTNNFENGIYQVTNLGSPTVSWVLTRVKTYDQPVEISNQDVFTVTNGTVNSDLAFRQSATVNTIGTDAITFVSFTNLSFSKFNTLENACYEVVNPSGFDQFYITYLKYALADRICSEFNYVTPANVSRQLDKYRAWINKKSNKLDLSMQKVSSLGRRSGYGWAYANLGRGFIS